MRTTDYQARTELSNRPGQFARVTLFVNDYFVVCNDSVQWYVVVTGSPLTI